MGYVTLSQCPIYVYNDVVWGFGNSLQLMLLFVKIKYAVLKTYGGLGYKRFA